MDPAAAAQHSDTGLALLIGAVMGALRLAERLCEKWFASRRKQQTVICRLDAEASAAVAETLQLVRSMHETVDRRDSEGAHLVYPGRAPAEVRTDLESLRSQAEQQHESVMRAVDRRRA